METFTKKVCKFSATFITLYRYKYSILFLVQLFVGLILQVNTKSTWGLVLAEAPVTRGGFWRIFPMRKRTTVNWLLSENYSQDVEGRGVDESDHGKSTPFALMGGVRAGEKRTGEIQQGLRWGERLRGLMLKRSPLKKLMGSCNVFMKDKNKKRLSRETVEVNGK